MDSTNNLITRQLLTGAQRVEHTAALFGIRFPTYIESFVFDSASSLSEDYDGGLWDFYSLSNGGFYMAPSASEFFEVFCANGFEERLSADAFGITACIYGYSLLSFSVSPEFGDVCARHYHWLREYLDQHVESSPILRAID